MEEIKALNDDALEQAAGGELVWCPDENDLEKAGLSNLVRRTGGWSDIYYDTWREKEGIWKNVGSEDMLKYVERTLGADDPRYKELYKICYPEPTGHGHYR